MADRMWPQPGMTLVWDVDDVLNTLTRRWFEDVWLDGGSSRPGAITQFAQLTRNPPHEILGITREEYLDSLDAYRACRYSALQPRQDILGWMARAGHRFRHLALTAVPLHAAAFSGEWVYRHWGRWIRGVHVVPSARKGMDAPRWDSSKTDFLRWLGRDDLALIDDHPDNLAEASEAGFRVLRVPQPWNGHLTELATLDEFLARFPG